MSDANAMVSCEGCGLVIPGGTAGCLVLYQETFVLGGGIPTHLGPGRLAFDTYCIQHPDTYCVSTKSLAFHLASVCWGLEYGAVTTGYERLRTFFDGPLRAPKPALPARRGALTVADIAAETDVAARLQMINQWARSAWDAYADLQPWARGWIEAMLGRG